MDSADAKNKSLYVWVRASPASTRCTPSERPLKGLAPRSLFSASCPIYLLRIVLYRLCFSLNPPPHRARSSPRFALALALQLASISGIEYEGATEEQLRDAFADGSVLVAVCEDV